MQINVSYSGKCGDIYLESFRLTIWQIKDV